MDSSKDIQTRLITLIQTELTRRKGTASMIFQNHLYGCFIMMEDIAQDILELSNGYITGNSLYLCLDTQFEHIGFRYYGFLMDGRAILDASSEYKQAWLDVFQACSDLKGKERVEEADLVDQIEEEVIRLLGDMNDDQYFINAMEHDGNLTPDWMEKAIYGLHPELRLEPPPMKSKKRVSRCLAVTRRRRVSDHSRATTRRQGVKPTRK